MIIDSNVLTGHWPFRRLVHKDSGEVRKILEGCGITHAVASSLDAILFRNVQDGNEILYRALSSHRDFFTPAATINPSYAGWEKDYEQAVREQAAAIRVYPEYQNWNLLAPSALELYQACEEKSLPLILTAEIEDSRQRHFLDRTSGWQAGEVRQLLEQTKRLKILVVNAGAERIREISFTLPEEQRGRLFFDISALWGPFVDDLALCVKQIGTKQFVFGSHAALKTPETALTRLRLSKIPEKDKDKIYAENIKTLIPRLKISPSR